MREQIEREVRRQLAKDSSESAIVDLILENRAQEVAGLAAFARRMEYNRDDAPDEIARAGEHRSRWIRSLKTGSVSLIYEPKGKAREYAALAVNIYRGCDHGCTYCYAPSILRMNRHEFHAEPTDRGSGFLKQLEREAAALTPTEPILLCFTCDPYCQLDVELKLTRETIKILHAAGHSVNVLTKGGTRALRDIDLFQPGDSFGCTLTTTSHEETERWEPGAASYADRTLALSRFNDAGVYTWVSLEPVIDPAEALKIIRFTQQYVDFYKVGRWNYDPRAEQIDWRKFAADAVALLKSLDKLYLIKKDLAVFLEAK